LCRLSSRDVLAPPHVVWCAMKLKKSTVDVLLRYRRHLLGGEFQKKLPRPKVIGETPRVLFIDKPAGFTCTYGLLAAPRISNVDTADGLLHLDANTVQIHEYIARAFDFELAIATREFWKHSDPQLCTCTMCGVCASYQAGLCHRLDTETSGVMVVAKDGSSFSDIRQQFNHRTVSKSYLALVHGAVDVSQSQVSTWCESDVPVRWDQDLRRTVSFTGDTSTQLVHAQRDVTMESPVSARTRYRVVAQYRTTSRKNNSNEALATGPQGDFSLLELQIITGRRHQI